MHVHIVLCCGAKTVLVTNKLSERWCHISIPYLFTKFHTSKHLGKKVTQTCMFTLFLLRCKKVLFTNKLSMLVSYHKPLHVYKVSCIQAFRYESYTNMHVHIVLCCGAKRVL